MARIEFGENFIKIGKEIFYLNEPSLKILKAWIQASEGKEPEELEDELLVSAKALAILKPGTLREAYRELYTILMCRYFERKRFEEIIDKIYKNCSGGQR